MTVRTMESVLVGAGSVNTVRIEYFAGLLLLPANFGMPVLRLMRIVQREMAMLRSAIAPAVNAI